MPPIARLTLERLARPEPGWAESGACVQEDVDMMTASKERVAALCGGCTVSEQCDEASEEGDPVRFGWRANRWRSKRTPAPLDTDLI